ncbi:WXG100 family type VII secretion target [Lachnospiraceae bacterium 54-11]
MEGILKVTPEKLIQTSGEFATTGNQMKSLTSEMMSLVQGMKGIWQGEAASAYGNKFQSLQTDMDKLYRMVQEHVKDLQEMAALYQKAETGNAQQSGSLNSNMVV